MVAGGGFLAGREEGGGGLGGGNEWDWWREWVFYRDD